MRVIAIDQVGEDTGRGPFLLSRVFEVSPDRPKNINVVISLLAATCVPAYGQPLFDRPNTPLRQQFNREAFAEHRSVARPAGKPWRRAKTGRGKRKAR